MLAVLAVLAAAAAPFIATAQGRPVADGRPLLLSAEAVLLLDPEGKTLFSKNPDEERAPASLVKLMTLYLGFEDIEGGKADLDELVTISRYAALTPRSRMGLRTGEAVPLHVLLEGVAIASANDAATAQGARAPPPRHALRDPPRSSGSGPAEQRPRSRPAHLPPAPRPSRVAADAGRPDVRLPGPRVRPSHPAVQRPPGRAGAEDRIHTGGRIQPRGVGVARRAAVRHDRARLAHAHGLVPRRQEASEVRLRRGRAGEPARAPARAPPHAGLPARG